MIISEQKLIELINKAWRIGHEAPRTQNQAEVDLLKRIIDLDSLDTGGIGFYYMDDREAALKFKKKYPCANLDIYTTRQAPDLLIDGEREYEVFIVETITSDSKPSNALAG